MRQHHAPLEGGAELVENEPSSVGVDPEAGPRQRVRGQREIRDDAEHDVRRGGRLRLARVDLGGTHNLAQAARLAGAEHQHGLVDGLAAVWPPAARSAQMKSS